MAKFRYNDPKEEALFGKSFIIYLLFGGVTMLFTAMMVAYMHNRSMTSLPPLEIPTLFYISTPIIILVSYFGTKVLPLFDQNEFSKLVKYWAIILILLLLFMILQYFGWQQLIEAGYPARSNNSMGYLFVLSIAHFVHIIFGLPFHIRHNWIQYQYSQMENLERMGYLANSDYRHNLKMILRYWHFLDLLWLILMGFFILNSF